jgi:hypothetical protein
MNKNAAIVSVSLGLCVSLGCVKEISADERLDRETERTSPQKGDSAKALQGLTCDDIKGDLVKARDEQRAEEARLTAYLDLLDRVQDHTRKFEDAMAKNPDLAYQEGSEQLVGVRDECVKLQADVRSDLEVLVREIMVLPVVDEYKGGATIKAQRLNFELVKTAIEKMDFDDKQALFDRIADAEAQLGKKKKK